MFAILGGVNIHFPRPFPQTFRFSPLSFWREVTVPDPVSSLIKGLVFTCKVPFFLFNFRCVSGAPVPPLPFPFWRRFLRPFSPFFRVPGTQTFGFFSGPFFSLGGVLATFAPP